MRGGFVALIAASVLQTGPRTAVDQLVERAAAYVRHYQQQLTAIIADETYGQQVRAQVPRDTAMPRTRTLGSEVFFMFMPGHDWMAIRDVLLMDGRPVGDRPDVRMALRTGSPEDVARRFKRYNSRYNLGRVIRNFNEPTLSLLVLDDAHRSRFTFEMQRVRRERNRDQLTLTFREKQPPTLIRSIGGKDVFATGELTIEPVTGRITRAVLALAIDSVRMTLTTTYAADEKLGMWVPVRFGEWYEEGRQRNTTVPAMQQATYEEVVCEAKYSNFRRFEVKAMIR